MENIGFIGTGTMAKAIISGVLKKEKGFNIICYDKNENNYEILRGCGVSFCDCSKDVLRRCKYVVLAVKPQNYLEVLKDIKDTFSLDNVIISIAAGIDESFVSSFFGFVPKFVQVMPNTPLVLGCGATAMCKGSVVDEQEFNFSKELFSLSGVVCEIPRDKMNFVVPINGSSPAFIYYFAKGFLDFAVESGIDKSKALTLFCNSLIGSAKMMLDSGKSIDRLIDEVTSKKGTTEKGLLALKDGNFLDVIKNMCQKTVERAFELSK